MQEPTGSRPSDIDNERWNLVRDRWLTVLLAAPLCAGIFLILVYWRRKDVSLFLEAPRWVHWAVVFTAVMGLCLAAIVRKSRTAAIAPESRFDFWRVRYLGTYPPLWLTALLATGFVFLAIAEFPQILTSIDPELIPDPSSYAWLGGGLCVVFAVLAMGAFLIAVNQRTSPLFLAGTVLIGPGLLAVIFALAAFASMPTVGGEEVSTDIHVITYVIIGAVCLVVAALATIRSFRKALAVSHQGSRSLSAGATPRTSSVPVDLANLSFDQLEAWVRTDSPIAEPEEDLFGRAAVAARIVDRINSHSSSSQALVGPLGSGKTSVGLLVKRTLETFSSCSNLRFVLIELWPFESAEAAAEGILSKLVSALSLEVSTLSLRGLPKAYADAMGAAGGLWGPLGRLQTNPLRPDEVIRRINDVAVMIGLRYVLWIEDLERFAGGRFKDGDDPSARSVSETASDRINLVRALLFGLGRLHSFSVITATTDRKILLDVDKSARYVELLSPLPQRQLRLAIGRFREGALAAKGFVEAAEKTSRDQFRDMTDEASIGGVELFRAREGDKIADIKDALVAVSPTLRALKQGLRRCVDSWQRLIGEIDFDDLMLLSLLREAMPDVFQLIQRDVHIARSRGRGGFSAQADKDKERAFSAELDVLTSSQGLAPLAARRIVDFVFDFNRKQANPQGVMNTGYWERFLADRRPAEEECDQPVLRVLSGGNDNSVAELLEDEQRSERVQHFWRMLDGARLVRLLGLIISRRSAEDARSWSSGYPPGVTRIARILFLANEESVVGDRAIFEEVQRTLEPALCRNMALVSAIADTFCSSNRLSREQAAQLSSELQALVVGAFSDDFRGLWRALQGANSRALRWIFGEMFSRLSDGIESPSEGWRQFAGSLLAAGNSDPATVVPQLCHLIKDGRAPDDSPPIDEQMVARWFPGDEIWRLLRATDAAIAPDDSLVQRVLLAAKNRGSGPDPVP